MSLTLPSNALIIFAHQPILIRADTIKLAASSKELKDDTFPPPLLPSPPDQQAPAEAAVSVNQKRSNPIRSFACGLCNVTFAGSTKCLTNHLRDVHSSELTLTAQWGQFKRTPFRCNLCKPRYIAFSQAAFLEEHVSGVHKVAFCKAKAVVKKAKECQQMKFLCAFCSKRYVHRKRLTGHVLRKHPGALAKAQQAQMDFAESQFLTPFDSWPSTTQQLPPASSSPASPPVECHQVCGNCQVLQVGKSSVLAKNDSKCDIDSKDGDEKMEADSSPSGEEHCRKDDGIEECTNQICPNLEEIIFGDLDSLAYVVNVDTDLAEDDFFKDPQNIALRNLLYADPDLTMTDEEFDQYLTERLSGLFPHC